MKRGYFEGVFLFFMDLKQVKIRAKKEIEKAGSLKDLDKVFKRYLGKKGQIAGVFAYLKGLGEEKRKKLGKEANLVKQELGKLVEEKSRGLKEKTIMAKIKKEKIDVTRPGAKIDRGHLHPLTLVQRECANIFRAMGFEVVLGPEVETEWYNFDALNFPKEHPARDIQDTFWIAQERGVKTKLLPRTHTSPVQVRYMEKHNPPLRIVVPGRVFRNEATDPSHEVQFYQLEGLMVDKDISAANFKAIIEKFLELFFKTDIEIRLRPGYFPFTEPSFEIDVRRKDRSVQKGSEGIGSDWLEMMGAGMVHPNVFRAAGLNPKQWQGFAFGVGIERLAMVRYKVHDIRLFYQSDLRFLKQF